MVLEPNNTLDSPASLNLVHGFDEVVDQLRNMMGSLQSRVSSLTNNLRVASEVSTQIATILDLEQLLPITVDTVKERFGLYHVHIYLYDPFTNMLVMKAGSGEAGKMMRSAKHQIPLDAEKSLVARAARNDQAEVIMDVLQEPNYLPNPLLPLTRSEMAIPLSIGERVLGVLDVQAVEVGFFNQTDIQVHSTLADQLAVAIENAEIFSRMQDIQFELEQRNYEMEIAAQISSQVANILQLDELLPKLVKSIANGFNINRVNIFLLSQGGLTLVAGATNGNDNTPFDNELVIDIDRKNCFLSSVARAQEPMFIHNMATDPRFVGDATVFDSVSRLGIPIIAANRLIGVLDLQSTQSDFFKETQVRVHSTLASQLAIAIENAQAFAQVKAVQSELLLSNQAIQASTSGMLVVDATKSDNPIIFVNPAFTQITGYSSDEVMGRNCRFLQAGDKQQSGLHELRAALKEKRAAQVIIRNYRKDGEMFWNQLQITPITDQQGNLTHYVGVQNDVTSRIFSEQREMLAYELGQQLNTVQDQSALLQFSVDRIASAFNFYHVQIYRYDATHQRLVVAAGLGQAGRQMVAEGYFLTVDSHRNLVARCARSLTTMVSQRVHEEENYTFNPLIPNTQSQATLPLYVGRELLGVLDLQSDRPDDFGDSELRTLGIVASQLSVAIANSRELENSRQNVLRFQALIDTAPEAILVTDAQTLKIVQASISAAILLETSLDQLVGRSLVDYSPSHQSDGVSSESYLNEIFDVTLHDNSGKPFDWVILTQSGKRIITEVRTTLLPTLNGGGFQYRTSLTDVTRRKEFERNLAARAVELQTLAEVTAEISTNLDLDTLLVDVCNLIQNQFYLYHVHIYLLDDSHELLILAAGAGEVGIEMVSRNHQIKLTSRDSAVAQAAQTAQPVVLNDLTKNMNYLTNPLLPFVRSEMAIPMIYRDTVIGVLDFQSDKANNFILEETAIFETLSRQVSVAVQNARAFRDQELSNRRNAISANLSTSLISANNEFDILDSLGFIGDIYNTSALVMAYSFDPDKQGVPQRFEVVGMRNSEGAIHVGEKLKRNLINLPLDNLIHQHQGIWFVGNVSGETTLKNTPFARWLQDRGIRAFALIPLRTGMNWQGVAIFGWNQTLIFDDEIQLLLGTNQPNLSSVVAIRRALIAEEFARKENERRARELETIAAVSAATTTIMSMESLLHSVSELTKDAFELYHAHIYLYEDGFKRLTLAGGAGEAGQTMVANGHSIPLNHPTSIVARVARELNGLKVDDVSKSESYMANPYLPYTRSELAVPIVVGNELLGVLDVQATQVNHFTEEDITLKGILAAQIAVAIDNARAFEAETEARRENERRAVELETVAQVSTAAATILDVDGLLLTVSELTKAAFELYHAHIYLYMEEYTLLELRAGAGEPGRIMMEQGHSIPIDHPSSIVAKCARTKDGVLVENVLESPTFMPNPLLPDTHSELAVPMVVGDKLVGVMDVQSDEVGRFSWQDVGVFTKLGAQVGVAIENARAFELSEKVAERERQTSKRLREVDRLKSEFLASMSHELRTPLTSIIGYSEVLLDGGDGDLSEDAQEDIDIIYTSGKHLLAIINDILDLAKIEAGKMSLSRKDVDLVKLLRDLVKANQVLVRDKPIEVVFASEMDHLIVPVDEVRMRQIVLNLFSNASKFTDEGQITIHLNMHDDLHARIAVEDTGIGITPENLKIVFDQFRQVDGSSTRRAGGTGLGLTITRYLIQMHGGEIYVESEYGKGSVFWFTVPLIEPSELPDITLLQTSMN